MDQHYKLMGQPGAIIRNPWVTRPWAGTVNPWVDDNIANAFY